MLGNIHKSGHSKNSLFAEFDYTHRYNSLSADRYLRDNLKNNGIELNTPDVNEGRHVDFNIFIEAGLQPEKGKKNFLIAMENPLHNSLNRDLDYLSQFDLVFSWDSEALKSLGNYVFCNIPHQMTFEAHAKNNPNKFLCLINANKNFKINIDGDLYAERVKLIRWYEQYASDAFDLYGIGWDKPYSGVGFIQKQRRNMEMLYSRLLGRKVFPSWLGEVSDKSIYLKYKFAVCYENSSTLPFYITEKMLDAMSYGCVPVYWGAPNVSDLIPRNCFIDRRDFSSNKALHNFLHDLDDSVIEDYKESIKYFMLGVGRNLFSYEATLGLIVKTILSRVHD